jgi:hypothetical protein
MTDGCAWGSMAIAVWRWGVATAMGLLASLQYQWKTVGAQAIVLIGVMVALKIFI